MGTVSDRPLAGHHSGTARQRHSRARVLDGIGFDRSRKKLVLRQFHVEGFVNQYAEDAGTTADRLSFTSEQIENIPPGWRARETYIKRGSDAFEEIFELAEPGKAFEVYSHARFTRIP